MYTFLKMQITLMYVYSKHQGHEQNYHKYQKSRYGLVVVKDLN